MSNLHVASIVYLALILLVFALLTNVAAQVIVNRFEFERTGGADGGARSRLLCSPPVAASAGGSSSTAWSRAAGIAASVLAVGVLAIVVGSVFVKAHARR